MITKEQAKIILGMARNCCIICKESAKVENGGQAITLESAHKLEYDTWASLESFIESLTEC